MYSFPYNYYRSAYNPELDNALELIAQSVRGERNDELFYDYLISKAPTSEEKEIIGSIRDDERKHNQMFRRIYKELTGTEVQGGADEEFQAPPSYLDGIKRALFGELMAVEKYRKIMIALPQGSILRDMMFEIISDELKHSAKYNYLFTLNASGIAFVENISEMPEDMTRQAEDSGRVKVDLDEWARYVIPLINMGITEAKQGASLENLLKDFVLAGVLVGLGHSPEEAREMITDWKKNTQPQPRVESRRKK